MERALPDGTTEASLSLSGTLYVDPDKTDYSTDSDLYYIYLNLIYQKENGDLFITPGSPVSIMNEGESTTQTFSESYTESGIDSNATTTNTISLTPSMVCPMTIPYFGATHKKQPPSPMNRYP